MVKTCVQCGKEFVAQRDSARFCCTSCRVRAHEGVPSSVIEMKPVNRSGSSSLVASVRARVESAALSEEPDGLAAILLAEALEANVDGSKLAALYRQFTVAMDRIEVLVPKQGVMDELRLRRDRKRSRPA